MNDNSIASRVARGVALLDQERPDWWRKDSLRRSIDVDKVDVASPCNCVLGQTWPNPSDGEPYASQITALFGRRDGEKELAHGFNGWPKDCPALTTEWKRVILARRGGAK